LVLTTHGPRFFEDSCNQMTAPETPSNEFVHEPEEGESSQVDQVEQVFGGATEEFVDLDALIEAAGSELFHYARAVTGSRPRAEDAVQDLFVALLEQRRSLSSVRRPRTWLFTVLRNIARRSRDTVASDLARDISESVEADPAERLVLKEALQTLDPRHQEIVLLHVWEGLTFAEIAEVLGIPRGTALSSYHRSMARLRERMGRSHESCAMKGNGDA
jgi:RNA polymerase sigma-70 factor (ECF subfamily)